MYIEGNNNKIYRAPSWLDSYYKLFLGNIILRPHCYRCKYKNNNSRADITIADYWGIRNIAPCFGREGEVSLVILHNTKAVHIFENMKDDVRFIEADIDKALTNNPSYYRSVDMPEERRLFFTNLNKWSYKQIKKNYVKLTIREKMKVVLDKIGLYKI